MDNFKKAIAALTAIISMAFLGVGTISASAADLDAINEKILNDTATEEDKVIASCTDSDEIKAMEYLIDSNTSIEEVQLAKQIYDEGLKELQSTASNSCDLDFYSNNGLIPTRHYITLVDIKPNAPKDESILLNVKENIFTSNVEIGFLNPYTNSSRYSIHDIVYDDYGFMLRLKGNGINVSSPKLAGRNDLCFSTANLKNAAEAKGENASEKYLYDCLGVKVRNTTGTFELQTYALADVYRDGTLSAVDSLAILQYLDGTNDLLYTYNDGKDHGSSVVNTLAADVNHDGTVTNDDVTLLNKYLVGSATLLS